MPSRVYPAQFYIPSERMEDTAACRLLDLRNWQGAARPVFFIRHIRYPDGDIPGKQMWVGPTRLAQFGRIHFPQRSCPKN